MPVPPVRCIRSAPYYGSHYSVGSFIILPFIQHYRGLPLRQPPHKQPYGSTWPHISMLRVVEDNAPLFGSDVISFFVLLMAHVCTHREVDILWARYFHWDNWKHWTVKWIACSETNGHIADPTLWQLKCFQHSKLSQFRHDDDPLPFAEAVPQQQCLWSIL